VLRSGLAWGAATFLGSTASLVDRLSAQPLCDPAPLGDLLGLVPLHGDQLQRTPLGRIVGGPGLDARLFTDLSALHPEKLVTPTAEMFVRTAAPAAMHSPWVRISSSARGMPIRTTLA